VERLRELALGANDPDARDEDRYMLEAAQEIEDLRAELVGEHRANVKLNALVEDARSRLQEAEAARDALHASYSREYVKDTEALWKRINEQSARLQEAEAKCGWCNGKGISRVTVKAGLVSQYGGDEPTTMLDTILVSQHLGCDTERCAVSRLRAQRPMP